MLRWQSFAAAAVMQLVCTQADFSQNLGFVSRAVASRPTHPILANVLLEADPAAQTLAITAFDLSLGIRCQFEAQVQTGGRITVPARLLSDIVSRLSQGNLSLELNETVLTVTAQTGKYQLNCVPADEFPELPALAGEMLQLPVDDVLQGIGYTLFAASSDESKQVLTGVHVHVQGTALEFAATDGHRLARVQVTTADPAAPIPEVPTTLTVPARTLRELERLLGQHPSPSLTLHFDRAQMVATLPDVVVTSRLLEGQYPNYRQLLPQQFERQATVERKPLIAALERLDILAAQKNHILKLQFSSEQLSISVDAPDVGGGREMLPIQMTGGDLEIAFNVKYLLDALKVFESNDVSIKLNGATQPAVLSPLDAVALEYLVMPVQIRTV